MINLHDRIKERTYTIGTGNFALSGVVQGFSSFSSAYPNSGELFYAVTDGTNYEIGSGVYLSVGNQIQRFPIKSTNNNNLVNFTEGLKEIYVTYPATNAVFNTSGLFPIPQNSGLTFWNSSNSLSSSSKFVVDSGNGRLGINKSNPITSIDIGGPSLSSNIRASGFIVGNSGVFFPSGNNGLSSYLGGTQLTHFEMNQTDAYSALVIELSGNVNQNILLKKQNAGMVFAGPPSGCSPPCSPQYPNFRILTLEDIPDLSSLYERSSCNGRLSIDPVNPLAEGNGSNLYFVPYNGNRIGLYNGTSWKTLEFSSTLVKNVNNMLPIGVTVSNRVFDVFAYSSGNTVQFESVVWTNQTTRQVELYLKDGILVKFNDYTRRYIGSVMPIDFGGYPPTGGNKFINMNNYRYIFNYYNRINYLNYYKTSRTWTCDSNSWRQLLNTYIAFLSSLTINVLCGVQDDTISVNVAAKCESPNLFNPNYMITVNSSNFDLNLLESSVYISPTLTKHTVGIFSLNSDYPINSTVQLLGSINQVVPVGINTYYVAERKPTGYTSPSLIFDYSNGLYGTWRC